MLQFNKILFNPLPAILDDFIALQQKHLGMLARGAGPLQEECAAREELFNKLQSVWADAAPASWGNEHAELQELLTKRIKLLIENEQCIYDKLKPLREHLLEKMKTMRRGKHALEGYGPGKGTPRKPRFLSKRS